MKVLHLNAVPYGSTFAIANGVAQHSPEKQIAMIATGYSYHPNKSDVPVMMVGGMVSKLVHIVLARFTGLHGCFSVFSTLGFVRKIRKFQPDILHLHNLHCWYVNLPILFSFIKKHRIPIVWTLHDCWAFTGHCPHFALIGCAKWKNGCHHCSQYRNYPESFVDQSKLMWKLKKRWFNGVHDLTLVTPSRWLAGLAKESFLGEYPVRVINNGIDLNVFRPIESNFREEHGCGNKFIVLGVAFDWGVRKGLDVFFDLAEQLDSCFQIVLVGVDEEQKKLLPKNIIAIHRTQNQEELAAVYSAADLFVNPTREDTFPTVNMEALACGTPVLTFRTGGSPEILDDTCGVVVDCGDVAAMKREIVRIAMRNPFSKSSCLRRAKLFDRNNKFLNYISLYEEICHE